MLAAGQPVPQAGEFLQTGESVALVLNGVAVRAWREAGEQWKVWSPRLASVHLQIGSRKRDTLHVLLCYALTQAAHRGEKDKFYDDLQQALGNIPSDQPYIRYTCGLQRQSRVQGEMLTSGTMCAVRMGTENQMKLEESYWLS